MSTQLNVNSLIKQSSCTNAPDCWHRLEEKGLDTQLSYTDVSMAFWNLSQQRNVKDSPKLTNRAIPSASSFTPTSSLLTLYRHGCYTKA